MPGGLAPITAPPATAAVHGRQLTGEEPRREEDQLPVGWHNADSRRPRAGSPDLGRRYPGRGHPRAPLI